MAKTEPAEIRSQLLFAGFVGLLRVSVRKHARHVQQRAISINVAGLYSHSARLTPCSAPWLVRVTKEVEEKEEHKTNT